MKQNLEHVVHAVILGVVLCLIMKYALGQGDAAACSRSIVLAAGALIYMIMFGHSFPPTKMNPALVFWK